MFCQREVRPTEFSERAKFIYLWMEGKPVKEIAKDAGTSTTTVYRWIRRWRNEGAIESRPRSGRPRVTSREEDFAITSIASMLYPMSSYDIIHYLKLKCSPKTVRRRIHESRTLPLSPFPLSPFNKLYLSVKSVGAGNQVDWNHRHESFI